MKSTALNILLIAMIVLNSCSGSESKGPNNNTIIDQPDTVLFWTIDDNNKTKTRVFEDTIKITDAKLVINGINSIYPSVKLKWVRTSNDTVYAKIDSASTFTEDMGSFGASEYIATVVVNLTTLDSINYVNLDFPPGSHAAPGTFSKANYKAYSEKK
ncbi:MAG: hypothetical protein C5B52_13695 [Bacteroidetes bacterium]|nr:MAG: hypothetical protein C5B52_13695 [Bacteroidota bacterium]